MSNSKNGRNGEPTQTGALTPNDRSEYFEACDNTQPDASVDDQIIAFEHREERYRRWLPLETGILQSVDPPKLAGKISSTKKVHSTPYVEVPDDPGPSYSVEKNYFDADTTQPDETSKPGTGVNVPAQEQEHHRDQARNHNQNQNQNQNQELKHEHAIDTIEDIENIEDFDACSDSSDYDIIDMARETSPYEPTGILSSTLSDESDYEVLNTPPKPSSPSSEGKKKQANL